LHCEVVTKESAKCCWPVDRQTKGAYAIAP